jgi:predicted aldo/keto reductase-like oxidoreductase
MKKLNRRNFLKTVGAAGFGSVFTSAKAVSGPNEPNAPAKTQKPKFPQLPRRKLGKTGIEAPCLSFGMAFNTIEAQALLKKALQLGINHWDTGHVYSGGNSELGIGKFLAKNPDVREKLFIAASGAKTAANAEELFQTSLKRLNTNRIDLYYGAYMMSDPAQLTDELKQWAEDAKKRKLIRFFGFTTHKNMAQCLIAAAKLDWIDVIMTAYNFRLSHDAKMQAAIEACHKAGIGLVAMKTQAMGSWGGGRFGVEEDKKLIRHFQKRGFTVEQAKIKTVLEDKRFASACVGMGNVAVLTSNVAAVLDKTKLTQADTEVFGEYAKATCSGYCAGCANICNAALPAVPYISDVMRYLMYYNSYGDEDRAKQLFAQIPASARNNLLSTDYTLAEARCPQHIPISRLIAEAVSKLV